MVFCSWHSIGPERSEIIFFVNKEWYAGRPYRHGVRFPLRLDARQHCLGEETAAGHNYSEIKDAPKSASVISEGLSADRTGDATTKAMKGTPNAGQPIRCAHFQLFSSCPMNERICFTSAGDILAISCRQLGMLPLLVSQWSQASYWV